MMPESLDMYLEIVHDIQYQDLGESITHKANVTHSVFGTVSNALRRRCKRKPHR
jgi:hypothetical protein